MTLGIPQDVRAALAGIAEARGATPEHGLAAAYAALLARWSAAAETVVPVRVEVRDGGTRTATGSQRVAVTDTYADLLDRCAASLRFAAGEPAGGDAAGAGCVVTCAAGSTSVRLLPPAEVVDPAGAGGIDDAYGVLLAAAVAEPDRPVGELPVLTDEQRAMFAALDAETTAQPPDRPLHELFAEHVARTPDAVAVRCDDAVLTYAELDRAASRLAQLLRSMGVGRDTRVALCLPHSEQLVVAVLGVLKSGGCYVPVDPGDPPARMRRVLSDADPRVVVTTAETASAVPDGLSTLDVDRIDPAAGGGAADDPVTTAAPTDAAYLLYTSGSTGQPKGVVVEHRNLTSYVLAVAQRLGVTTPMSWALVQPLTVDSSVTALAVPLATGGQTHVVPRAKALDADALADRMQRHAVDCLKIAPSHLRALQSSPRFADLLPRRLLVVGGEPSEWAWLRDIQRRAPGRVFNHYGPTETTVGVLTLAVDEHLDAAWSVAPIGIPLPNTTARVVDAAGEEVPLGAVGELVIGGANVARGYHGDPERTAAAFPETPEGRAYRTGDLVRRLPDGSIAFVGRRDDQVKVRGFRVELGEIDAALTEHPEVRAAVSAVRADAAGARYVVGYVEPAAAAGVDADELERFVRARLPEHMVPRRFVVMDRLPLSPHGKVDRAALPDPAPDGAPAPAAAAVPSGGTAPQRLVTAVWAEVLGRDTVRADDNFFDAGGHSLLLVELHHRLQSRSGRRIELLDLFQHPTVRAQADLISRPAPADARPGRPAAPQRAALAKRRQQQLRSRRETP